MDYNNKAVNKFNNDMDKIIKTGEGYEDNFYTSTVVPACINDTFLEQLIVSKEMFPHNLYLVGVGGIHPKVNLDKMTLEELDRLVANKRVILEGGTPVEKGGRFEDTLANIAINGKFMKKVADIFPKKLEHVGEQHKREDFLIDDKFSIDIKYSESGTIEKFKNIVKPGGASYYSAINDIEESILRSMYKEGANQGRYRPNATGATRHHGILDYNKDMGWREVTQEDYNEKSFGPLPSLRKNILYIYNDDGYGASFCLRQVTTGAANHLEELGFTEYTKDEKYRSYDPKEFGGFSNQDGEKRQLLYGKTN